MGKTKRMIIAFGISFFIAACNGPLSTPVDLSDSEGQLGLLDSEGLMSFLNDQNSTDTRVLDKDCDIRADSAANIVVHRDGPDNTPGTHDDDLFDSLSELEQVHMVGPWTMQKLYICAASKQYLFADERGLLDFMNDSSNTTLEKLDIDCGIRSDSAAYLIQHRDGRDVTPGTADDDLFDSIEEIDSVDVVGLWTIERLYECAERHGYVINGVQPDASITVHDFEKLDSHLQEVILEDLMGRAEQMADGRSTHTVRFAAATTYLVDNVPSFYDVRFVQALDPADGVEMWIVFKLDADFVVIGSRTYLSGEI